MDNCVSFRQSCIEPRYSIQNAEREEVLSIKGPCCMCSGPCCTWDQEFIVSTVTFKTIRIIPPTNEIKGEGKLESTVGHSGVQSLRWLVAQMVWSVAQVVGRSDGLVGRSGGRSKQLVCW